MHDTSEKEPRKPTQILKRGDKVRVLIGFDKGRTGYINMTLDPFRHYVTPDEGEDFFNMTAKQALIYQRRIRVTNAKAFERMALMRLEGLEDEIEDMKYKYERMQNPNLGTIGFNLIEAGHRYNIAKQEADEATRKVIREEAELEAIKESLIPRPISGGQAHGRHKTSGQGRVSKTPKRNRRGLLSK